MPGRTADHLFWIACNTERADQGAPGTLAAQVRAGAADTKTRNARRSQDTAQRCSKQEKSHA